MATFTIRTFRQIGQGMLNSVVGSTAALTDFTVGAVARCLLEACAVPLQQLYQDTADGIANAMEENVYTTFNFPPLAAQAASTSVTFSRVAGTTAALTFQAGGQVGVPGTGKVYTIAQNATMASGASTLDVLVVCSVVGSVGNTTAGTITALLGTFANVAGVVNAAAATNGQDPETPDARRVRFQNFLQTLSRGTVPALLAGAKTAALQDAVGNVTETVQKAAVVESGGAVTVYVHNGQGATSAALVAQAGRIVAGYVDANGVTQPGYRSAGVTTTVVAAADQVQNVTVSISPYLAPGYTLTFLQQAAVIALRGVFAALDVGQTLVFGDLLKAIRSVDGVGDAVFTLPTANVAPAAANYLLLAGTLTVA